MIPENDEDVVEVGEFVQGNQQLPSRKTKINYTPSMIKEIKKCKNSIIHFAEGHFYIVNLDRGREKIKLYPIQKKVLQAMNDNNRFAIVSSRQMGKCVYHKTLIHLKFKPLGISFRIRIGWFYKILKFFEKKNLLSQMTRLNKSRKYENRLHL